MKGTMIALLLAGCLAGAAGAQEVQWRAAPAAPPVPPPLGSCVAVGQPLPLPAPAWPVGPRVIRASGESTAAPSSPPRATRLPDPDGSGTFGPDPAARPPAAKPPAVAITGPPAACVTVPASPAGAVAFPDAFGDDPSRFYASAEYLLWWFKQQQVPPLLTTGPANPNGQSAFLGEPGTVVLVGGGIGGDLPRSGGRFTVGAWCDDEHLTGVEASGFFLGQRSFRFVGNSSEFPVLARPFFDVNAMAESAQEAVIPGVSSGSVSVSEPSNLWGAEIDLRCNLCCSCGSRLDFLVGPRYLQLDEGLHIQESLLGLAGAGTLAGSHITVTDNFETHNHFYGGQVGLDYALTRGMWSLDVTGKLALGEMHQDVNISGSQVIVSPAGAVSVFNGGLLALSSNSGHFSRDRFAVLPELGVTFGCQLTDWCRLTVGYSFLYCSSVVRPGDQIDRVLNPTLIPNFTTAPPSGPARPAAFVRDTDFWAQGVNVGLEFRF
jgi:hypothetical protein